MSTEPINSEFKQKRWKSSEEFEFPILETRQLSAFFGDKQVLFDIDLQIPKNNVVAFIGHSGCG